MRDAFSAYHPIINFIYFTAVISFGIIYTNPVLIAVSFICAFGYLMFLKGWNTALKRLAFLLPLMLIAAIMNPLFNHHGSTILFYLHSGNPITLEAVLYGISASGMLALTICWFECFNLIMTSDKFMYLFGKTLPSLSLILSMVLRFVPRFNKQLKRVLSAQKCIGRSTSGGGIILRIKCGLTVLSAMTTWALENSIDTADSMNARGYGLGKRTSFSNYRFYCRDIIILSIVLITSGIIIAGSIWGAARFRYFPRIEAAPLNLMGIAVNFCYILLCALPLLLEGTEILKWKRFKSKI